VAKWGQVEDYDRVQDQVREQGTFAQGKLFLGWFFDLQKKKKYAHVVNRVWKSILGILCTNLKIYGSF
jgi:hypothetical protein